MHKALSDIVTVASYSAIDRQGGLWGDSAVAWRLALARAKS